MWDPFHTSCRLTQVRLDFSDLRKRLDWAKAHDAEVGSGLQGSTDVWTPMCAVLVPQSFLMWVGAPEQAALCRSTDPVCRLMGQAHVMADAAKRVAHRRLRYQDIQVCLPIPSIRNCFSTLHPHMFSRSLTALTRGPSFRHVPGGCISSSLLVTVWVIQVFAITSC